MNDIKREKEAGLYIGETSRSLFERVEEHMESARRFDSKSFIMKHWASSHPELTRHPKIKFKVVKRHSSALTRLIHEEIRIDGSGNLNSKSEWRYNRKSRLTVEKAPWQEKTKQREEAEAEEQESKIIESLKSRFHIKRTDMRGNTKGESKDSLNRQ